MAPKYDYDAIIIGTGPVGLMAALALLRLNLKIAVCGPFPRKENAHGAPCDPKNDSRTAALLNTSATILSQLDLWSTLGETASPVRGIRLVDDLGRLPRAPEVLFQASDVDAEQLAWNISNTDIVCQLSQKLHDIADRTQNCQIIRDILVDQVKCAPSHAVIQLSDGQTYRAKLVVGADGRRSRARLGAGIKTTDWTYNQRALTTQFAHSRPHHDISTEFHRPSGPLTVVPMAGRRSSLVWVTTTDEMAGLEKLSEEQFAAALEEKLQGLLGTTADFSPRTSVPLSAMLVDTFAQKRVILAGEAAHVLPPIGAQGLNLGIRDVAVLSDCVQNALRTTTDIGGTTVTETYHQRRRQDVWLRTHGVDLLNRSLSTTILPVNLARGLALHAANAVPLLRQLMIEGGMATIKATDGRDETRSTMSWNTC
ncbi:MAG: FAD-dependent monooxygenase [Hyphomicrobiaceae bacterium]